MHYRDTLVWNRAMEIVGEAYRLGRRLPREEMYGLRSQLTRAAVSIACNIAEGWTRESRREKAQFLAIAHGSAAEAETLVTVCERTTMLHESQTHDIRRYLDETSRMLTTLRRTTRSA
jgi:four helix bundle protein